MRLNWLQHRYFARQIAELHLTVPQFFTLSTLFARGGESSMGDLARETQQVSATMTGIIDRLSRANYVERHRDEHDRRLVQVVLTRRGYELIEKALAQASQSLRAVLDNMEPQKRQVIAEFMDMLAEAMRISSK
jgi:DNA-binding MarR family transcriptional regulator